MIFGQISTLLTTYPLVFDFEGRLLATDGHFVGRVITAQIDAFGFNGVAGRLFTSCYFNAHGRFMTKYTPMYSPSYNSPSPYVGRSILVGLLQVAMRLDDYHVLWR